jgi:hypothetical protein
MTLTLARLMGENAAGLLSQPTFRVRLDLANFALTMPLCDIAQNMNFHRRFRKRDALV